MTSLPLKTMVGAVAAASVLTLAAATPAGAAGWVTAPPVSAPSEFAFSPKVAVSPTGERFVAWEREMAGGVGTFGLAVRVAPAGADFGPVQLIPDASADDVSLTTGPDGTAALVWDSSDSIHVATRPPGGGAFTEAPPVKLGAEVEATRVAMRGADVFIAAATEADANNTETTAIHALQYARGATTLVRLNGTGPGGVVAQTSVPNGQPEHRLVNPTIALAGDQVHVAWEDQQDAAPGANGKTTVDDASGPAAGGPLSAPVPVDSVVASNFFRAPSAFAQVAAGAGHVDVAFVTPVGAVVYHDLAGTPGARTVTPDGGGFDLRAGVDPAGNLILGWERFNAGDLVLAAFSAIVPPSGPPGPVVRLTAPNANRRLDDLEVGPDGSAVALTDRFTSSSRDAESDPQAVFRAPGSAFGNPEPVTGAHDRTGGDVSFDLGTVAVGPGGRALVATEANDGSGTANNRVFVSERDATPPALTGITVPATATVGTSVPLSATASDALSPFTLTWDFGDDSQATGASVRHTFATPGSHVVTVRALDGAGNAASATRVIAVKSPDSTDRRAPRLSALAATRTRTGTVAAVRVDERATLVFSLDGRSRRRTVTKQPIVRSARGPGRVTATFRARLSAGSYRLSVSAIDAAGNRSRPASVRFTVAAR